MLGALLEPERQRVLHEWNATRVDYGYRGSLTGLLEAQAAKTPDLVAVSFEGHSLTYAELDVRANQLADALVEAGVGPEMLVGICMERSLEMVVGLLGILKAGGCYVPLDPGYPKDRLTFMAEDARARVLLTQRPLRPALPVGTAASWCVDEWERFAARPKTKPPVSLSEKHLAYVIYTSGSTGRPKGAMNTHQGICNRLLWMQDAYGLSEQDAVLQKTPFSFDVSVWEFFWPLLTGARLVMARPQGHLDPSYLASVIAQERITTVHFVPSMLSAFLDAEGLSRCGTLRQVICSGEALPAELVQRFFGRLAAPALHNLYGPTEASVDVTHYTCRRGEALRAVPIGKPIANCKIHILSPELEPLAPGVEGELYIGGIGLGRGYLGRPELTAEKFVPDPFAAQPGERLYRSGDLARYRTDGEIEYLGRIDHQVKIRGFRIELGEIEEALSRHPAVKEVVVMAREDGSAGKRLVAYFSTQSASVPSVTKLRDHCQARLPEHMVPAVFVRLPSLPLSPNGKIDRKLLPPPPLERPDLGHDVVVPREQLELELSRLWEDLFGIHPIGVTDDFFALGGNSLLALRMMTQIEQRFSRALPLHELFEGPTVEKLAARLRQQGRRAEWSPLVKLHGGDGPPLFLVHPIGGSVFCYAELARRLGANQPVYGLQARGVDGALEPLRTIPEMARSYLDAIRAVQPSGPYYLGGWSFGGTVAYEMAQLLRAAGEEVALLALIDARATTDIFRANFREFFRNFAIDKVSFWFALVMGRNLGFEITATAKQFEGLTEEQRLELIRRELAPTRYVLEDMGLAQLRTALKLFHTNLAAMADCVPHPYQGKLTLLRASEPVVPTEGRPAPPPWAWERYVADLEVHDIPGTHFLVLRPNNVAQVASRLRDCLSRARAAARSTRG